MVRLSGKQYKYLYGPVPSRRLGSSLGIDLVPRKICTYDCIYCQIGKTTKRTLLRREYVPVKEVLKELEFFLQEKPPPIDHFSLSGSGEPILHSKIALVIKEIKAISSIPVAVITNGSLLYQKKAREDLLGADIVLPSLDAVTSDAFQKVNRPHPRLSVERVIDGIAEFRKVYKGQIWLEILFCKGINDTLVELKKMKEAVKKIKPDLIHINTVIRPPSEDWVKSLSQKETENIRAFFGEKASIISEFDRHLPSASAGDIRVEILRILRRRPLSLSDLSKGMGISKGELEEQVSSLIQGGRIKSRLHGDSIYYEIK